MRKNIRCIMTLLAVFLCLFITAAVSGEEVIPAAPDGPEIIAPEGMPDIDTVRDDYAERMMRPRRLLTAAFPKSNRDKLTEAEKGVYDCLKAEAALIANGQRANTIITVPAEAVGLQDGVYLENTGNSLYDPETGEYNTPAVREALKAAYEDQLDTEKAVLSLMYDDPYLFYWMDKRYVAGFSHFWNAGLRLKRTDDGRLLVTPVSGPTVYLFADVLYVDAGCSPEEPFAVDTAKTGAATRAAENARAIIAEAAGKPDIERMTFYMQRIRDLSEYNHEAAEGEFTNASPWQLIYVFDGDPETRVVCEGFSKAFRYLCENTVFIDKSIRVYSVTGTLEGGGHMWNTVHLSNGNYLVDITNCLTGGSRTDSLFFSTPESGNPQDGYVMVLARPGQSGTRLLFKYDDNAFRLYTLEELTLTGTMAVDLSGINVFYLPDGVTEIGSEAFLGVDADAVVLPAGKAVHIGSGAFAECGSLKYVIVPAGTELTYEEDAFTGTGAKIVYQ